MLAVPAQLERVKAEGVVDVKAFSVHEEEQHEPDAPLLAPLSHVSAPDTVLSPQHDRLMVLVLESVCPQDVVT